MVNEPRLESLTEAFRRHNKGKYRPHRGPSGMEFEKYKEGGQSRDKPSHNQPTQSFGTTQNMKNIYDEGLIGSFKKIIFGSQSQSSEDYLDLSEEISGEHGVIDPSEYNVPQVQDWMDRQLEMGDYKMVGRMLAAEESGNQRVGVLDYLEEDDLRDINPEEELEDLTFFNDKSEFEP